MVPPSRRVNAAFWGLGLINNFTFVLFLTAAEEIIQGDAGLILVCTVVPGLVSRLALSFCADHVPYQLRIVTVSISSTFFCIVVAVASSRVTKLLALILQAAIGALGEISFLALTSQFSESVVGSWASGTGAAGVAAAGAYVFCRDVIKLSPKATLIACSPVSLIMIILYIGVLAKELNFEAVAATEDDGEDVLVEGPSDCDEVLSRRDYFPTLMAKYMLPLAIVYFAEYSINQGVLGTLTKFKSEKNYDVGKTYSALQFAYQVAVFISRSSIQFVQIHKLWVLPVLQMVNLVILALSSMFILLPSVFFAFAIVFWEGLLGGLTYVNAFAKLRNEAPTHLKEWALGTATVGDATGISIAAVFSMWLESAILNFRAS